MSHWEADFKLIDDAVAEMLALAESTKSPVMRKEALQLIQDFQDLKSKGQKMKAEEERLNKN